MTEYETISVIISGVTVLLSTAVVFLMWQGIKAMVTANKDRAAQAAEDRQVTQAMLVALKRQGAALEELIRRPAPPPADPAE